MWPFKKNNRRRCMETRKVSSGEVSLWHRFLKSGGLGAAVLAAGFYACLLILDLWPANPMPYKPSQYIHSGIYARVPFAITNRQQLEKMQSLINEQSTFVPNSTLIGKIVSSVQSMPESLKAATQPENASEDIRTNYGLDDKTLDAWREFAAPEKQGEFASQIAAMRNELAKTVIVSAAEAQDQRNRLQSFDAKFIIADGGAMQPRPIKDMIATDETTRIMQACEEIAKKFKSQLVGLSVQKYLLSVLAPPAGKGAASVGEATYTKDAALTKFNREQALAALAAAPPQTQYAEGDLLVQGSHLTGKNRDVFLKSDNIALIEQEHVTYVQNQRDMRPPLYYGKIVGRATVLLLVVVLLCVYIARIRPELVADYTRLAALAGVFLTMAILIKFMSGFVGWNGQVTTVLPVLLSAIILAIVFDQRFAWTSSMVFSLLMVLQLRTGLDTFIVFIVAVTAAIFQLKEIRTRTKLPFVAAVTACVVFIAIAACGMVQAYPWRIVGYQGLLAGGAAFLLCLTQVMLPVIERIFGVATSMTLLEFADASKPVLKRLALEAPGTYNHSLQLGTLCEAAAEAVGANGLLARVGAYYHDIGKINKPDYFVENQAGSPSKHQKLSPAMSLLIITGHVKDGIELAREYRLPRVLHEFIASHHGTTLVQYFYHAAAEQRKTDADRAPDEVEFRYPGPKPKSREAAILMLADAAESSVRSMGEPTPGRIENQVHTMISRRLMDGQLDDCDLTLRQVHAIEASLIKSLTSMYHLRVAYPTPAGQKASASELMAARKQESGN